MADPKSATNAEEQVASYFSKYEPKVARLGKALRAKLQARLPGLSEVVYVYENQNALLISYSPSGKGYQGVLSLALYPDSVKLFFAQGARLSKADPGKLLRGSAGVRHVELKAAADLDRPEIEALMEAALKLAQVRLDPGAKGALILRADSQKQRAARTKKAAGSGAAGKKTKARR
jgi:hypothetical protein